MYKMGTFNVPMEALSIYLVCYLLSLLLTCKFYLTLGTKIRLMFWWFLSSWLSSSTLYTVTARSSVKSKKASPSLSEPLISHTILNKSKAKLYYHLISRPSSRNQNKYHFEVFAICCSILHNLPSPYVYSMAFVAEHTELFHNVSTWRVCHSNGTHDPKSLQCELTQW